MQRKAILWTDSHEFFLVMPKGYVRSEAVKKEMDRLFLEPVQLEQHHGHGCYFIPTSDTAEAESIVEDINALFTYTPDSEGGKDVASLIDRR